MIKRVLLTFVVSLMIAGGVVGLMALMMHTTRP